MQRKITHFVPDLDQIASLQKQVKRYALYVAVLVFFLVIFVWGWADIAIIALKNQ